jgi:hypothetical protein
MLRKQYKDQHVGKVDRMIDRPTTSRRRERAIRIAATGGLRQLGGMMILFAEFAGVTGKHPVMRPLCGLGRICDTGRARRWIEQRLISTDLEPAVAPAAIGRR